MSNRTFAYILQPTGASPAGVLGPRGPSGDVTPAAEAVRDEAVASAEAAATSAEQAARIIVEYLAGEEAAASFFGEAT